MYGNSIAPVLYPIYIGNIQASWTARRCQTYTTEIFLTFSYLFLLSYLFLPFQTLLLTSFSDVLLLLSGHLTTLRTIQSIFHILFCCTSALLHLFPPVPSFVPQPETSFCQLRFYLSQPCSLPLRSFLPRVLYSPSSLQSCSFRSNLESSFLSLSLSLSLFLSLSLSLARSRSLVL